MQRPASFDGIHQDATHQPARPAVAAPGPARRLRHYPAGHCATESGIDLRRRRAALRRCSARTAARYSRSLSGHCGRRRDLGSRNVSPLTPGHDGRAQPHCHDGPLTVSRGGRHDDQRRVGTHCFGPVARGDHVSAVRAGVIPGAATPPVLLEWSPDAVIAAPLLLGALWYALGLRQLWTRGQPRAVRRWQAVSFAAGWSMLAVALASPIHSVSDTSSRCIWCSTSC